MPEPPAVGGSSAYCEFWQTLLRRASRHLPPVSGPAPPAPPEPPPTPGWEGDAGAARSPPVQAPSP